MATKGQPPVVSKTKKCTICKQINVAFYPKRGACVSCHNAQCLASQQARKAQKEETSCTSSESNVFESVSVGHSNDQAEAFIKMQAEMDEFRDIVAKLHNSNALLQDENKEMRALLKKPDDDKNSALAKMQGQIKELMHESKKQNNILQTDSLGEMRLEIIELQAENRELRGFLQKPKKADLDDSLAKLQAEIKRVRDRSNYLETALHAQSIRIEGMAQKQGEMQFAVPDIVSDWEPRCDSLEKTVEKLEKAQVEHEKYTKTGFETVRSQLGDDKTGNKVLAAKIDALTISIGKIEDPDKTPKPSPRTRKSGALKNKTSEP